MSTLLPATSGPVGPANLNKMPTELLLDIYKNCPDFSAIWALANTSQRLSDVFDTYAAEIVDTVFLTTVPESISLLVKAVVQIRTGCFDDVETGNLIYVAESKFCPFSHPPHLSSDPLSYNVPPALLRKFVSLAHKIHVIAHLCIKSCLQKLASAMGTSVGSPSWLAEQRAIISLWRMQFFFELKNRHRNDGRLTWHPDPQRYPQYGFDSLRSFFAGRWVREQVLTLADFVDDEIRTANTPSSSEGISSGPSTQYSFPDMETIPNTSWDCKTVPPRLETTLPVRLVDRITYQPVCSRILYLTNPGVKNFKTLWDLPALAYRKFGFSLWDPEMLEPLGLCPAGSSADWRLEMAHNSQVFHNEREKYAYFSLWEKLLTQEEVQMALPNQPYQTSPRSRRG